MGNDTIPFEFIDHTADLGIIVKGENLESLFRNAALAMTSIVVSGPLEPSDRTETLHVEGADLSDLLVKWLGEILYLLQGERLIPSAVRVNGVSTERLDAELDLVEFDRDRHGIVHDIKAVTYHQAMVSSDGAIWSGRVIFDL